MGGDIEAIKNSSERKGRAEVVSYNKAKLFAEFINKSSLVDIPCKVANEVVYYARKVGRNYLHFKVDFEKSYEKVSWNFLRYALRRMGCGLNWMELLVFKSNISAIVNGSPTMEFEVRRGLRQGEGTWKHVSEIKVVLRAFELVSGLGINYHKSKLIGINSSNTFLETASIVLSCKVVDSKLYFLGIPIGFNLRKKETWRHLLQKMKNRLVRWKNHFLNLGGRITLLKSILSSLTIFTMSFYKMPVKSVKEFTRLQKLENWELSFFKCSVVKKIWREIALCIGKSEVEEEELCLSSFYGLTLV
ncbi:uncharacterized protein LOC131634283 [Vicia villosa]|uniref:uncharacterized protein LOC131634283 n=1 Tax=Vicia villosa TaxID=3911 RepID=UPI00273AB099|nr:uncharacterized protein LOC131634283 [Vicia villosa]